jgi:DNA-binding NarL/FixJ family response regulator
VVDQNELVHISVREALVTPAGRCAVYGYRDPTELVSRLPAEAPDVVLMAVELQGTSGIEWTERLRRLARGLPVIMHTAREDAESIFRSIMAGARGYLIKPASVQELRRAVACALAGWPALCPLAAKALVDGLAQAGDRTLDAGLSRREQEVAMCLFLGLSPKEISETMSVAPGTVHAFLKSLFKKLDVHSRHAAAMKLLGLE